MLQKIFSWALLSLIFSITYADTNHYIGIIDAGSTGSRLEVYRYQQTDSEISLPKLKAVMHIEMPTPLSSYLEQKEALDTTFDESLQKVYATLHTQDIPFYLLATAGMRQLTETQQHAIYTQLAKHLHSSGFKMAAMRTLPGWQEALFDWIAVNYISDSFTNTLGSLDLGGASMQIAYASHDEDAPFTKALSLGPYTFHVYARSFLGLGKELALNTLSNYGDPSDCYPTNYPWNEDGQEGHFNFEHCLKTSRQEISHFIYPRLAETIPSQQAFVAFSAFPYIFDFFEAGNDLRLLAQHIRERCTQPWKALSEAYPNEAEKYLKSYCFAGVYTIALLHENFGFSVKRPTLTVSHEINHQSLSWSIGAALFELRGELDEE